MERSEGQDCPKCGVYNPAGREKCWRCNEILPLPQPKKKKRRLTSQHWLYIMMAVFVIISLVQLCGVPNVTESPSSMISPPSLFSSILLGLGIQ